MTLSPLILLPQPRLIDIQPGVHILDDRCLILLDAPAPADLRFTASRVQKVLKRKLSFDWETVASKATPPALIGLTLTLEAQLSLPAQGYTLEISSGRIHIKAGDLPGLFYGVSTLAQIIEQAGGNLPCLKIEDWPDFPARGVMLDISRDKVYSMETLYDLVDLLAGWKINQLQLYTEHTFAYQNHPKVWAKSSPMTGQEILDLDAYCKQRYIELVPNQNSFGHLHRWLTYPDYSSLAELHGSIIMPWGTMQGPFSLCPTDPASIELISSLYDEILPHFSSRMINVGCDETFDLGQGRSKEACEQQGSGRVYLDFLLKIYHDLKKRGFTMQFWGDIILHSPELIPELPKDVIALEWGYEANHPFADHGKQFAAAGIPFYVCPGTSAWASIAGRSDNAIGNLLSAAENGIKNGAIGYLITDWGDSGHWQTLPISYLGFLAGAAYSWALEANRSLDIPLALDIFAFHDSAKVMGCLAYELGNIYQKVGVEWQNTSALFLILQRTLHDVRTHHKTARMTFQAMLDAIDQAVGPISQAKMDRLDKELVLREFQLTARMLAHACKRGILASGSLDMGELRKWASELDQDLLEIIHEYTEIWLIRNRPGGLAESVGRLEKARQDYQQEMISPEIPVN